jgi:hypothetical protein
LVVLVLIAVGWQWRSGHRIKLVGLPHGAQSTSRDGRPAFRLDARPAFRLDAKICASHCSLAADNKVLVVVRNENRFEINGLINGLEARSVRESERPKAWIQGEAQPGGCADGPDAEAAPRS